MVDSDSGPSAAAVAAIERARTLDLDKSPGTLITVLEDIAIRRIDGELARNVTELDRRFTRSRSKILADFERRSPPARGRTDRSDGPNHLDSPLPDVIGGVLAIVGASIVFAGTGNRSDPDISLGASAISCLVLILGAIVFHAAAVIRSGRPGHIPPESWKLVITTAASAWAGGAWLVVRESALDETAAGLVGVLAALVAGGAVALALGLVSRRRWKRLLARVKREQGSPQSKDLDRALTDLIERTCTEARDLFERLPVDQRAEFDSAVLSGIGALPTSSSKREFVGRAFRKAPPLSLRYSG